MEAFLVIVQCIHQRCLTLLHHIFVISIFITFHAEAIHPKILTLVNMHQFPNNVLFSGWCTAIHLILLALLILQPLATHLVFYMPNKNNLGL